MRTGAIFARGSCRALKWMALAGMVLALGAGQAAAQITLDDPPEKLAEGVATTFDVEFKLEIPTETAAGTLILQVAATGATPTTSVLTVPYEANTSTTAAKEITETGSFTITPSTDTDAENGSVGLTFSVTANPGTLVNHDGSSLSTPTNLTGGSAIEVEDDEEQSYVLTLLTRDENIKEGGTSFRVTLAANPAHVAGNALLTVELDKASPYTMTVSDGTATQTFAGRQVSNVRIGEGTGTAQPTDATETSNIDIVLPSDDKNTIDEVLTLKVLDGATVKDSVIVTVLDKTRPTTPPAALTLTPTTQDDITNLVAGTLMTPVQLPTATGGTSPYTYTGTPLPAGLTIAPTTGMLSGTPTTAGTTTVTYTATDSATPAAIGSLTFDITVVETPTPTALTLTPATQDDISVVAGTPMTAVQLPTATGGTSPYTYTATGLPAGLSVAGTTGMLSGTPTTAAAAPAHITYTVTDSAATPATKSLTFGITVTAGTLTFTPASQAAISVDAGVAMTPTQLPTATGGTAPYTYTATGLPAGLSVASATGMLSGTPTTAAAAATVTYTAKDSATVPGTGQLTFTITVTEPGVAKKTDAEIDTAIDAARMAADSDGDGKWTREDDPAAVALTAVFNHLPETFSAEATSSAPSVVQASVLSSSGLTRASNPAVLLTPLSAGMASVTVTAAGIEAELEVTVDTLSVTGAPSRRTIRVVTVGALREGGQAEATVTLNGPVERGRVFKAKLRLVGQMHTRENGSVAALASPNPYRVVGGVRVLITGELTATDYDAHVIGELTIQAGYSSGSVTIYTGTDADAEDERLVLQVIKDGNTFVPSEDRLPVAYPFGAERVFRVEDSHEQGYAFTAVPSKIYEDGPFTTVSILHFTPNYVREDVPMFVTLTSSHPAYSALWTDTTSHTIQLPTGGGGVTAEFQLVPERRNPPTPSACECDGDRKDDEVVVTATVHEGETGVGARVAGEVVAETTITVVDVDKLPEITVTAMTEQGVGPLTELAEGSKYKVRVEANRNKPSGEVTPENVTVSLALGDGTASADDYRLTPSSRTIRGGLNDQTATFDLEVLAGDGDIDDETLVLDAMVKGGSTNGGGTEKKGMLSVTLTDTTTLNVEPRSDVEVELAVATARNVADGADDLWTYGDDDLSIKLSDLFKLPAEGFTVTADAESADPTVVTAQADAGIVTVKAVGKVKGDTTVTVTATTAASGAQISPNIASVEFKIEVDELTRVYMVSGPDDMNLAEGGAGGRVTVSTNVPVTENTEVMLMRDGSSSAGDDDYTLEPPLVTIMAGEMSGSTMVMATEDNMAEEMEMLTLFLVVDGTQMTDKSVSFYLWDAAVPALPVIAQLLLAALLAIGGCRRYLRR